MQDGGRVGRVGLEGGLSDRIGESNIDRAEGGQCILLDARGQTGSGNAKPEEAAHRDVDYKKNDEAECLLNTYY